jgi:glycosyltransferase involved in cell wall biosynthesis
VAVLVDLERRPAAGGHVKCWERFAEAARDLPGQLDLTVYFQGKTDETITLGSNVRFRIIPPVFSTSRLFFLPYTPDHTDLAPFHPRLARELAGFDVLHTTDGFFAQAQTAARIAGKAGIALTTSIHTDTPSYARIFTDITIRKLFGTSGLLTRLLVGICGFPQRSEANMNRKLTRHLTACRFALTSRPEDQALAARSLPMDQIRHLRMGVDTTLFHPSRRNRALLQDRYGIAEDTPVILFVGRLDIGKNVPLLLDILDRVRAAGQKFHLIACGEGPLRDEILNRLPGAATCPGNIPADALAPLYASADLFVFPSEVETWSMAAVEALAAGLPVIAAKASGIGRFLEDGAAGRLLSSMSPDAWAAASLDLLRAPETRQKMRHAARLVAETRLAGWKTALIEDLLPIWQQAATEMARKG